jgi:hypothetical protein
MEHPRFISGELSTDFVAEEWETRKKHAAHVEKEESQKADEMLSSSQLAALVGGLLMQEQVKEEKLRRRPAVENGAETSRWRDVGRKEGLRRM